MTATELAALIVAIASVVAVVLLAFVLVSITKTLKEVRAAVEVLRVETLPVMIELGDTVRSANAELERVGRRDRHRASRSPARSTPPRASPTSRSPTRSSRAWRWRRAPGERPGRCAGPGSSSGAPSSVLAEPRHRGRVRGARSGCSASSGRPSARYAPERVSADLTGAVKGFGTDIRVAVADGRDAMREREAELRADADRTRS